ncbi:hypothetical protein PoB_000606900 [Plakobranchus ocellatus]|uniref:Uncharacterized protein n=1 Tax=Plakobranchus ocellatus TaxID=259542 RepID=A0AAV3YBA7_9GAST|nr:hypothetical protein PoB_000606900 [Plakobranchus ocellatus]
MIRDSRGERLNKERELTTAAVAASEAESCGDSSDNSLKSRSLLPAAAAAQQATQHQQHHGAFLLENYTGFVRINDQPC